MTDAKDPRAARLKAALRENLRRRKAQVRGRSEPAPAPGADQTRGNETDSGGPDSDKSRL